MDVLKDIFGKFLFPILLVLAGLTILGVGISGGQNSKFILAGVAILLTGVVSLLYTLGIITRQLQIVVSVAMLVGSLALGYVDYRAVKADLEFVEEKSRVYSQVIQRLKDIRTAEVAYKKVNERYCDNFDTLKDFLNNGQLPIVKAIGSVPDTLSEEEALEMGIISRDTILVPVIKTILDAQEGKNREFAYDVANLDKVPVSNAKVILRAGFVERGGQKVPCFEAADSQPFDIYEPLKVGSMTDPSTSGNWTGDN